MDLVDASEWGNNNMYLRVLDKFNEYTINCLITPGSKFNKIKIKIFKEWDFYLSMKEIKERMQ